MRINGMNKVTNAYRINSAKSIKKTSKTTNTKDSLALSEVAKELQIAKKAINNTPDIRMDKVDAIKKKIASGNYNISAKEVADKIVDSYFDKKL